MTGGSPSIPKHTEIPFDYNSVKAYKSSDKVPFFNMVTPLAILSGRPKCIVTLWI
jgi:hypothetical protein